MYHNNRPSKVARSGPTMLVRHSSSAPRQAKHIRAVAMQGNSNTLAKDTVAQAIHSIHTQPKHNTVLAAKLPR